MERALEDRVWLRAKSRCEYCHFPAEFAELRFQIDHIISKKHGGRTEEQNLALACFYCNSYKGPNLSGIDDRTGKIEVLFNPREDDWAEHFDWAGPYLVGLSGVGRATIHTLNMNEPEAVNLRRYLMDSGIYGG